MIDLLAVVSVYGKTSPTTDRLYKSVNRAPAPSNYSFSSTILHNLFYIYLSNILMGLDTVELVMEFEKYFNINIPDPEAEQMATLQSATETIARIRQISSNDTSLQTNIFNQVVYSLHQLKEQADNIKLSDLISSYLSPADKDHWDRFTSLMKLEVPKAYVSSRPTDGFWDQLKKRWTSPLYDWHTVTIEDFVYSLGAANYTALVNPKTISTKYEIAIVVAGITVNRSGVDYYELAPGKSFTSDLGMD